MVGFLIGPAARLLAGVAATALLAAVIYLAGYHAAQRACQAAQLRAELATARAVLRIAREANDRADQLAAAAEREADELQQKVDDYAKARIKNPACRMSPADAKRLRALIR